MDTPEFTAWLQDLLAAAEHAGAISVFTLDPAGARRARLAVRVDDDIFHVIVTRVG